MPEHEIGSQRAVFDYEQDAEQDVGGRTVADWGGDELFTQVPRRRFSRAGAGHRTRGAGEAAEYGRRLDVHDARHAARSRQAQAHVHRVAAPELAATPEVEAPAATTAPAEAPGRRVVTITGRPGPLAVPTARSAVGERRRPPRTPAERIGSRPDRIAAWAFGLGLTLILIAVSTADAAAL